jgi:hypothetical protein
MVVVTVSTMGELETKNMNTLLISALHAGCKLQAQEIHLHKRHVSLLASSHITSQV